MNKYDYILIDSPAGIDNGFQTAIRKVLKKQLLLLLLKYLLFEMPIG